MIRIRPTSYLILSVLVFGTACGVAFGDLVLTSNPANDMGSFSGQVTLTTDASGKARWAYFSGSDIVNSFAIATPPLVTTGAVLLSSGSINGAQDAAFLNNGANDVFDIQFDTNQNNTSITLTGTGIPFAITFPTTAARSDFYAKSAANVTLILAAGSNSDMNLRLAAIPEPSAFLYLGLGGTFAICCRRRLGWGTWLGHSSIN